MAEPPPHLHPHRQSLNKEDSQENSIVSDTEIFLLIQVQHVVSLGADTT